MTLDELRSKAEELVDELCEIGRKAEKQYTESEDVIEMIEEEVDYKEQEIKDFIDDGLEFEESDAIAELQKEIAELLKQKKKEEQTQQEAQAVLDEIPVRF